MESSCAPAGGVVREPVVQPCHHVSNEVWEPRRARPGPERFCGVCGAARPSCPALILSSRHFLFHHTASARAHKCLVIGKDTYIKVTPSARSSSQNWVRMIPRLHLCSRENADTLTQWFCFSELS